MKSHALFQLSLVLLLMTQTHCASRKTPLNPQNPNDSRSTEPIAPTYKIEIKGSIKPEIPSPQESQPESIPETESKPIEDKPHPTDPPPKPIPIPLDEL